MSAKVRPTITVLELQHIVQALREQEQRKQDISLLTKLDLLLYKTQVQPVRKESREEQERLPRYEDFESLEKALEVIGKAGVLAGIRRKEQSQLTREEIEFMGKTLTESL